MLVPCRWGPLVAALLLLPAVAHAHDPPFIRQIRWDDESGELVLWTNRGIIFGNPSGGPLRLLCNEAVGINTNEEVDFLHTATGALLVGTSGGLVQSSDGGCSFTGVAPFESTPVYALQRDPQDPARLLLATGAAENRAVHESLDDGGSWQPRASIAELEYYEELLFSPAQAGRVYAGGLALETPWAHFVAVSDDGGSTWERRDVALLATEGDLTLLAVSPTQADTLVVKALDETTDMQDRLLLSRDGGQSFEIALQVRQLRSAQFSADGRSLYVTGIDGLWVSQDAGATFQQQAGPERMSLAVEHAGALYACGYFRGIAEGSDGVGRSLDGGGTFEPVALFDQVTEPADCAPESASAMTCETLWKDWQREYGLADTAPVDAGGVSPDAGPDQPLGGSSSLTGGAMTGTGGAPAPATAGASAGTAEASGRDASGCSCRVPGRGGTGILDLGLVLLAAGWLRRRCRRRAQRRMS